jgi:hypothetical protein
MLEAETGGLVSVFAYPYGGWDGPTVRAVREAGYGAAVTVDEAPLRNGTPSMLVPRYEAPAVTSREVFREWLEARLTRR